MAEAMVQPVISGRYARCRLDHRKLLQTQSRRIGPLNGSRSVTFSMLTFLRRWRLLEGDVHFADRAVDFSGLGGGF
jgi:hypothetical protein